jgi:uncharacterized protein YcgL (UPF0745 family)
MTRCTVFKSSRKEYTYLYLREDLTLDDLPATLRELMGTAVHTMNIDLAGRRSLAKEDIETVRANLADPGYHLQLPPEDDPSGWLDLPKKA